MSIIPAVEEEEGSGSLRGTSPATVKRSQHKTVIIRGDLRLFQFQPFTVQRFNELGTPLQ
jgi:hypothetical protein